MLTRNEILKMIVGLKEVNDLDLLKSDTLLNVSCIDSDKSTVRAMSTIIDNIFDEFNYEQSPEFIQKIKGKSEQLQRMHRKLLDQDKLKQAHKRLGESITAILDSNDAFSLVSAVHHQQLEDLKILAQSLSESSNR